MYCCAVKVQDSLCCFWQTIAHNRRNWQFPKSIREAETCVTIVLKRMKELGPFPPKVELEKLLPWSEAIPDDCRIKVNAP